MIIIALLLTVFIPSIAVEPRRIYYVEKGGNFSTDDLSHCTEAKPCGSLQEAINVAVSHSTVHVGPGLWQGESNRDIVITGPNGEDSTGRLLDVYIEGNGSSDDEKNGTIFDCGQESRFIESSYGALSRLASLRIKNCRKTLASGKTATRWIDEAGGAVFIKDADQSDFHFAVDDVAFENNTAAFGGAMAVVRSSTKTNGSIFLGNTALENGGAIYLESSSFRAVNLTFSNNTAKATIRYKTPGGYAYDQGSSDETYNFGGHGGAIYFASNFSNIGGLTDLPDDISSNNIARDFVFDSCKFFNNSAAVAGGAVFVGAQSEIMKNNTFYNTDFIQNKAVGGETCLIDTSCNINGGAVFISNSNTTMDGCTFTENEAIAGSASASTEGGAIYSTTDSLPGSGHHLTLKRCSFDSNTARSNSENGKSGGAGGALCSHGTPVTIQDSCNFTNNSVGDLSMLFYDYSSSGGAIYFDGRAALLIESAVFSGNRAYGGGGGALYTTAFDSLQVEKSEFLDNQALSSYTIEAMGGAVLISHPTDHAKPTWRDTLFVNNSALPLVHDAVLLVQPLTYSGYGGAIYMRSADVTFERCNFTSNVAYSGQFDSGSSGGALFIEDSGNTTINKCRFASNGARGYSTDASYAGSGNGGAIYSKFSSPTISMSEFRGNWVSAGGLAYSVGGAILIMSEFLNSDGRSPETTATAIRDCTFEYNLALPVICDDNTLPRAGSGGALAVIGAANKGVLLSNCNFTENFSQASQSTRVRSVAGGILVAQQSRFDGTTLSFTANLALNGDGNDIGTPTSDQASNVDISLKLPIFKTSTLKDLSTKAYDHINQMKRTVCTINVYKSSSDYPYRNEEQTQSPDSFLGANTVDPQLLWAHGASTSAEAIRGKLRRNAASSRDWASIGHSRRRLDDEDDTIRERGLNGGWPPIAVLVNGGEVSVQSPKFLGEYHVFLGNVLDMLLDYEPIGSQGTLMQLKGGERNKTNLSITSYGGNVTILDDDDDASTDSESETTTIGCLAMLNSTLTFSDNIHVMKKTYSSILLGATLKSTIRFSPMATITFEGQLLTGFPFDTSVVGNWVNQLSGKFAQIFQRNITIYGCNLNIAGTYILSSEGFVIGNSTSSYAHALIDTRYGGMITIAENGSLELSAEATIRGNWDVTDVIVNKGTIVLNNAADSVSTARLNVEGNFRQKSSGILSIILENDGDDQPRLKSNSNRNLQGTVNVSLESGTTVDLYPPGVPTEWTFAKFENVHRNPQGTWNISSPKGLGFGIYDSEGDVQMIATTSVACDAVATYYDGIAYHEDEGGEYYCYVCLQSTCQYCSNGCFDHDSSKCRGDSKKKNCCPEECNNRGNCETGADYNSFSCTCDFFYSGDSCGVLSIYSYSIIAVGIFVLLFSLLTLRYYYFYRAQKMQVLEKLRFRLLNEMESDGGALIDDEHYLETLHQALILKDVKIKYSEIKIENKIGEGNFGVVYRASYRGAAVALKKMKAPMFMQMTEEDIEQFRREAAMMSRLRHPNIVLVMGVAFDPGDDSNRGGRILSDDQNNEQLLGKTICILTEFLEQGSLADVLYGYNRVADDVWSYAAVLTCAVQAAKGMLYLHSQAPPICHRDLKSSNLVVDDHWIVKVTDFGMSRIMPESVRGHNGSFASSITGSFDGGNAVLEAPPVQAISSSSRIQKSYNHYSASGGDLSKSLLANADLSNSMNNSNSMRSSMGAGHNFPELTSNLGTTAWCAPEVLTNTDTAQYSLKVDVYSFGIVLWELWERRRPFETFKSRFDIEDAVKEGQRPLLSSSCPAAYRALVERCWHTIPDRRPNFRYIVRFLTEELAKVKRQNTNVTGGRSSSVSNWIPGSDVVSMYPSSSEPSFSPHQLGGRVSTLSGSTPEKDPVEDDMSNGIRGGQDSADEPVMNPMQVPVQPYGTSPPSNMRPQRSWREQYVLRASGWDPSKPDAGLPPTVVTPQDKSGDEQKGENGPEFADDDNDVLDTTRISRISSLPSERSSL